MPNFYPRFLCDPLTWETLTVRFSRFWQYRQARVRAKFQTLICFKNTTNLVKVVFQIYFRELTSTLPHAVCERYLSQTTNSSIFFQNCNVSFSIHYHLSIFNHDNSTVEKSFQAISSISIQH